MPRWPEGYIAMTSAERSRKYLEEHPEKKILNILRAKLHNRNKPWEERLAYQRKWQANNRDKISYYNRKRKALVRGATGAGITPEQWADRLSWFDNRCAYCFDNTDTLTQDHVVPVSKGGLHALQNIVPACVRCNSGKKDRDLISWLTGSDWILQSQ